MPLKIQLSLILVWPIIASLISLSIKADVFVATLLFLALPSIYLSLFHNKFVKKLAFAATISVPIGIVVDYIMNKTGGWRENSYFPKVFDFVALDIILWFFLYIYFVLLYFESFIEKDNNIKLFYPQIKYFFAFIMIIFSAFLWFYFVNPEGLKIDYFYIKFGVILALIPVILTLLKFPKLWARFFKAGTYFFYFSAVHEFTSLSLNHWTFPGENQYIGFVELLGFRFPFEEFFFWFILGALSVLSFYEYFDEPVKR